MKRIEKDEFIRMWTDGVNAGKSVEDVARQLGMKTSSARVKASILRKQGINLPYPSRQAKSQLDTPVTA